MKVGNLLRFGAFVAGFVGIVAFYVLYGRQSVLDSVFFVVLTVSTVGEYINCLVANTSISLLIFINYCYSQDMTITLRPQ